MSTPDTARLLRRALLGNAAFSTLSGLTLLLAAGPLSTALGAPALALRVTGGVLLPFAVGLVSNARRREVNRGEAWLAVALDLLWVLASAALVFGDLWPLTKAGRWAVLGVAAAVLVFAVLQAAGLARSSEPGDLPHSAGTGRRA